MRFIEDIGIKSNNITTNIYWKSSYITTYPETIISFWKKNLMKVQVLEPFYRFAVDLFFDPNQVIFLLY